MQQSPQIYLDYNATTPVDEAVIAQMLPYFRDYFGNAASQTHLAGKTAARAVEEARTFVAELIQCEPGELIFTSGATESLNMAIKGVATTYRSKGNHIITWKSEHKAVLETCKSLESEGFEVSYLNVDREGLPDLKELENQIKSTTILVCAMMANNETGVLFPISEIASIAHSQNAIFLCDATQAPGKLRIDVNESHIDLLTLSAHKMYGPKGVGALFIRRKNPRVQLTPMIVGGGHEHGLRAGTLNVPGIVGMGKAAQLCISGFWDDTANTSYLRTILEQALTDNGRGYVSGSIKNRIPNTTNICFPGIKAAALISQVPNIALATGSACSSALPEPSHVLQNMGLTDEECNSSIRFSLGRFTTKDEILTAIEKLTLAIDLLKANSIFKA